MAVRPKLIMGLGIAIAGLGLIGAGAGATFTAQVSGSSEIRTGGVELTLNGRAGSDVNLGFEGRDLGSNFPPIGTDLVLENTGTLDLASTYLDVSATGCDADRGGDLAKALDVRLTEVTDHGSTLIFDGTLCSLASSRTITSHEDSQGFTTPPAHEDVGGQLPHGLQTGESTRYRLAIRPHDAASGLPGEAQQARTTVNMTFTGFDY
jgi:hypothetical protein